jgi:hypothetical protein
VGETDATAQKSIVRALWYAATPEAEAAVRAAAEDTRLSELARADARQLLQGLGIVRAWKEGDAMLRRVREAVGANPETTESELRAKRKARMRAVSDEALYERNSPTSTVIAPALSTRQHLNLMECSPA